MKTTYTITKIDFIGGSTNYNLDYTTYNLGEEFYSLPALEEAIRERLNEGDDTIIITQGRITEIEAEDFPTDEDRYEELEEYASIFDTKIATFENTFFN